MTTTTNKQRLPKAKTTACVSYYGVLQQLCSAGTFVEKGSAIVLYQRFKMQLRSDNQNQLHN